MTIEHINGIYYRNNRTEYSYGGERFQKIDKDAPEAVQRNRRLTVAERKPLAPNEWRGDVDGREKLITFSWYGNEANATSADHGLETYWAAGKPHASSRGFDAVHAALRAWASKPENLPHDVAIVEGIPYLMKGDEARMLDGVVRPCSKWIVDIFDYYGFAPGQRERVEKWRASQPKPLADDEVESDTGARTKIVGVGHTFGDQLLVNTKDFGWYSAGNSSPLAKRGQSLTNARNYAKKHLKLAPDEYLCEESWTVKKRERWVLNYTTTREFLGRPTRVRIIETEIFPGEE